jgi:hypothetical protein
MTAVHWLAHDPYVLPRYALRHVDLNGTCHVWTTAPGSAAHTARWLARDTGVPFEVVVDHGDGDGWVHESTWTGDHATDEAANPQWFRRDVDCPDDDLRAGEDW